MAEEGNGYNIDPAGEARAALQSAVAEYGRDALSNPAVMDGICRNRLPHLTGECILIGSAARSGVPALLRDRVGPMGTDQAIRSVAAIVSQRSSPAGGADASPDATPDPAADPGPDTSYSKLMSLIPSGIQDESSCRNYGTRWGAAAAIECSGVPDLSGGSLLYYLYTDTGTMNQGYDDLLNGARFPYTCTDSAGDFAQFVTACQSQYHNDSAGIAGVVSEYLDTDNEPTVSSTDEQQLVMTVMIGANANNVLAFWDNPTWIATGS